MHSQSSHAKEARFARDIITSQLYELRAGFIYRLLRLFQHLRVLLLLVLPILNRLLHRLQGLLRLTVLALSCLHLRSRPCIVLLTPAAIFLKVLR